MTQKNGFTRILDIMYATVLRRSLAPASSHIITRCVVYTIPYKRIKTSFEY